MRARATTPHSNETPERYIDRQRVMRTGAIAGGSAVACGIVGAAFGPFGAIVGLAIGGAAGYVLGDRETQRDRRDARLDRDIGVNGGNIGAAMPGQPAPRVGAFSGGSAGVGSTPTDARAPAEGPTPPPEDSG